MKKPVAKKGNKPNNSRNIADSGSNISQSAEKGLWQLLHSVA
jgi:hypothetical protein